MTTELIGLWSRHDAVVREGGGKAAQLHRLDALGYSVPPWFCVPASAFDRFRLALGLDDVAAAASEPEAVARAIEARIEGATPPEPVAVIVRAGLARLALCNADVAVRSSGLDEDSVEHSFAGQFTSFLYQRGEQAVLTSIVRCWASAYAARNLSYRRAAELDGAPPRMGVIVQRMVDSESAGVAFSRNPLRATDRSTVVIESVWGQGEGLVNGALDADRFEVDRETLAVRATVARKSHVVLRDSTSGTRVSPLDETRASRPSLADDQARTVARMVLDLERALGRPQDCEWAFANGRLWCLQTRPITTLPPDALFDARVNGEDPVMWDNSNIIESYAGVTTPLTFSHVSRCYREVYLQFSRLMRVPGPVIAEHEPMFRNMLGLVRGRIYYNLVNWYRLVSLFPGAARSTGFMESMMGVRQSLTPELAALFEPAMRPPRYTPWRRAALACTMAYRLLRAERLNDEFMARVARVCGPLETADLRAANFAEQLAIYRQLERELIEQWTAPIVGDTRCMFAVGILKALTDRWIAGGHGSGDGTSLQNDLLCGEGDLKSTEPTKLLMRIASRVDRGDPGYRARFLAEPPEHAWSALQAGDAPEIADLFRDFLRRYGFRCVNELKLEEPDLNDDPTFIVSAVQGYVRLRTYSVRAMEEREHAIRGTAEARVRAALRGPRRWIFACVVRWARRAVAAREMLRFERTRGFGVTRRLFRAIGANLVALGVLAEERDVFYLSVEELFAFAEGRSLVTDFRALVAIRRREFDEFRRTAAPPDRVLTRGAAAAAMRFPALLFERDLLADEDEGDDDAVLHGTPCSPGVVEGVVRVAARLEDAAGMNGEILVTERTDPGWVPVFPACAGLIIERGSTLSHSAVVARELGIPTIVGVRGHPMRRLYTGQRVRMDAGRGEIRIL